MQLYQGAVGTIRLSEAQVRASLDEQQRLSFNVGLAPDLRQGGSIKVSGLLPLLPVLPTVCMTLLLLLLNCILKCGACDIDDKSYSLICNGLFAVEG